MSTLRAKAEHIVGMFNVPDPGTRQQAIDAVLEVLQQPDSLPPSELREFFEAVKMIAVSLVQHQQFLDMDLQRVLLQLGMDDRFDLVYSKEQLDAVADRQLAQFRLINSAVQKLHNVGVRVGFQPGQVVDENALFAEFVALAATYKQAVQDLAARQQEMQDHMNEGEDWKDGPPDDEETHDGD